MFSAAEVRVAIVLGWESNIAYFAAPKSWFHCIAHQLLFFDTSRGTSFAPAIHCLPLFLQKVLLRKLLKTLATLFNQTSNCVDQLSETQAAFDARFAFGSNVQQLCLCKFFPWKL
jgi:hypothetical protein